MANSTMAKQTKGVALDQRTDIYAMGVILYEMLSGEVPYKGNTYPDLVLKIITGESRPVRELKPDLPVSLGHVCSCALALERDDRYPDARAMIDALGSLGLGTVRPTAM